MNVEGKRSFFESTLFLKVLSVFLAFIVWMIVSGNNQDALGIEVRSTFDNIPLSLRNMGADLVVVETIENVTLSLQGLQAAFDGLTPADLEAYVDLSGRKEGWHELRINAVAPPGVSIVRIEPAKANVLLDDLISRQMCVEADFKGKPAESLIVSEHYFDPIDVFVRGPRRKVDLAEKVIFTFNLEGAKEDIIARQVDLFPVDSEMNQVKGITVMPETADVWIYLSLPRKTVEVEALFTPDGSNIVSYIIEPQSVELQGPQVLLDTLDTLFTGEIDLEALEKTEGPYSLIVPLDIPEGLEVAGQKEVRVFFSLKTAEN